MPQEFDRHVIFQLGDMVFEYDEEKNKTNLKKHGLPLSLVLARIPPPLRWLDESLTP